MRALPEGKRRRPEAAGRKCPAGPRRYRAECPFDSMRKEIECEKEMECEEEMECEKGKFRWNRGLFTRSSP